MNATGDVLEVCEESDIDDQECTDSDDKDALKRKIVPRISDTVTFDSEPSAKRKAKRVKKLTKSELRQKRKSAQEKKLFGLVKPDVATNKEKERLLKRIATKGVVQLFNAVSERQRVLAEELSKKMSAKERREAEKRLQGSTFRVYPEENNREISKKEPEDSDEDDYVKKEDIE